MKKLASILIFVFAFTFSTQAQKREHKNRKINLTTEQKTNLAVKKMTLTFDLTHPAPFQVAHKQWPVLH